MGSIQVLIIWLGYKPRQKLVILVQDFPGDVTKLLLKTLNQSLIFWLCQHSQYLYLHSPPGNRSVAKYSMEFRFLAAESRWNNASLCSVFYTDLSNANAKWINWPAAKYPLTYRTSLMSLYAWIVCENGEYRKFLFQASPFFSPFFSTSNSRLCPLTAPCAGGQESLNCAKPGHFLCQCRSWLKEEARRY